MELQNLREIKPLYDDLLKKLAAVQKENEEFRTNLETTRAEKDRLAKEMEENNVNQEKVNKWFHRKMMSYALLFLFFFSPIWITNIHLYSHKEG